jgi:threonylcarbamoyladenosine tRNA methylthiotransferase MtaB
MPGKVIPAKIHERSKRLHLLSDKKQRNFYEKNIGKVKNVLFETANKNKKTITGFTDNYINVEHKYLPELENKIVKIKLKNINPNGNMQGEIIK